MPFEFKIERKLVLTEKQLLNFDESQVVDLLYNHLVVKERLDVKREGNTLTGFSNKSVLYYQYKYNFTVQKNENLTIWYEYNLIPVFKITVIMILFAAFFSKFSIDNLHIFSGVFIIIFFGFNILYINSELKNLIISALLPESKKYEEKLTSTQKEWINNPEKCSACGEEISHYNYICPECGLSINPGNKRKNTNITGFYNTKFTYKLTNSKKQGK